LRAPRPLGWRKSHGKSGSICCTNHHGLERDDAGAAAPVSTPASAGVGLDAQASIEQPIINEVTMTEITICDACNGNGFLRVPHTIYADQWEIAQCDACDSSGEVQASNEESKDRR